MTTDNGNIDDLLDDIPEDGQIEPQEQIQEPVPVDTPDAEPEATQEEAVVLESQVAKLFAPVDHSGGTVPVNKHVELRKRAQAAEKRVEELESKQSNVTPNDVLAELNGLVGGEDDGIVEVGQVKKILEKLPDVINNIATNKINETVTNIGNQNFQAKAKLDEEAIRATTKDYDSTVDLALKMNLISDAEFEACKQTANMPAAIYKVAQEKVNGLRSTLGVSVPASTTVNNNTPTAEPVADDEAFENDEDAFAAMTGGS
jgi:hypothetical protein